MKKGLISKIIKIFIVVLIPLLAGLYIGIYFYNNDNYENTYFDYYMEQASDKDTEDRLVSYLDYITKNVEYSKEKDGYDFYVNEKLSNEHGELFTLSIIRSYSVVQEDYINKKGENLGPRDTYKMVYYVALYDINYETAAKTLDPSGEHELLYTELPQFAIEIKNVDENNENIVSNIDMTTVSQVTGESNPTIIYDYGYSPEKDSKGNKLNGGNPTSMRYYVLPGTALDKMDSKVEFNIKVKSAWEEDAQEVVEVAATVTLDDFHSNKTVQGDKEIQNSLKDFNKGYNGDIYAAGYTKYVFGRYLWWQVLLAVIIAEVVCGSFVLVWNSESEKSTKNKKEIKKDNKK